jgi:hypothetical protein
MAAAGAAVAAAAPERQAEVAARGAEVMPFDLQATSHVFTKTRSGGLQQVRVKNPKDAAQMRLVRMHLRDIATRFRNGDFSAPTAIHGAAMPGLAELKRAQPGAVSVQYRDLRDGAQIRYTTSDPALVRALHQWFDAQLADHGADAQEGHTHHEDHGQPQDRGAGRH